MKPIKSTIFSSSSLSATSLPFLILFSISLFPFARTEIRNIQGIDAHSLTVSLNASVTFRCEGTGQLADLTWRGPSGQPLLFPGSSSDDRSEDDPRYRIDETGALTVLDVTRYDAGFYWCSRKEALVNATVWHLMIDPLFRFHLEMESITYGWYAGLGALIAGITVGVMKIIVKICCPQCHARASAAARVQQMRQLIVGLETYRNDQSTRLREHYNSQVDKVKESCAQQMEGLRDHYSTKITRFRNYRLPFGNYRDQYWQQVSKVRDYSSVQMERLHENYARNLGKLRTYSVVQLERFRLQYQLQHKHMAKILEAMNFNIDSCRAGGGGAGGDLNAGDVDTTINMDLSLAQLQMMSSAMHGEDYESDSFTIGPSDGGAALVVQADCTVRDHSGQEHDDSRLFEGDVTSNADYATPAGGGTPRGEPESGGGLTAVSEDSSPDADLLTTRLIELERIDRRDEAIGGPILPSDCPV
ncbi:hypothetical protein BV898_11773 [Hypsibius exemplaris]|uniref:Ig-like domain-containing protein n=1 Tax=Hypsibius exemplaris TaxID=2072580 RepID=A0A1W0WFP1_HYPEX|nr:hypothetical protein BV898_11773 [Hypsibius exemplaris]